MNNEYMSLIEDMFAAGVQYGHQKRFCHPDMMQYIYCMKNNMAILDLHKTDLLLIKALEFISSIAKQKSQVLLVGTKIKKKLRSYDMLATYAQECEMPYVSNRWLGGTLTNFNVIRKTIDTLTNMKRQNEEGYFEHLLKKERLHQLREIQRLEKYVGGIVQMSSLPSALVVIDAKYEDNAIREAQKLHIPVVAVVDTNCSTKGIAYPIPGNDDSLKAIEFYLRQFCNAINQHKISSQEKEEHGSAPIRDTKDSTLTDQDKHSEV